MDNYWGGKAKRSGNYGSRPVWRQRSSDYGRTPLAEQGKEFVPVWEMKFCESICSIPWHKLLEAQRFIHLYENVINWNDTAAEEAFKNAKSRFWAEMNSLPCKTKLPDPDTYIDKVDWNSNVDPELLLELEKALEVDSDADSTHGKGKPLMLNNDPVPCDGWGDLDDVPEPVLIEPTGWDNWDDDLNNISGSKSDLKGSGDENGWVKVGNENSNVEHGRSDPWQGSGNQRHSNGAGWGEETANRSFNWDHGYYSSGKNMPFGSNGKNQAPPNSHWRSKEGDGGYGMNIGFKSNRGRGRRRQERTHWQDKNPSGRW